MSELVESVRQAIVERKLLAKGSSVLVAVSGGVDSMVLLQVLHELAPTFRWRLRVAHFNHQLRGRSSDADERLVRKTAHRLQWPCSVGRGDVRRLSREQGWSIEMAARHLRHRFLAQTARKYPIRAIALAHHADDQVELFFVRLLRGAGPGGLAGMKWRGVSPADSTLALVRPLLAQRKEALRQFALGQKVAFREDASNDRLDALRNRLRHELLPMIRKRYQPAMTPLILRLLEILSAENEFMDAAAREWPPSAPPGSFASLPVALQRRRVQSELNRLGITADFDLVENLRLNPGRKVSLDSRHIASITPDGALRVEDAARMSFDAAEKQVRIRSKAGQAEFNGIAVRWQIGLRKPDLPRPGSSACEWFDADKIGGLICLRHWRPGDRFQPIGMRKGIKLQDLFTNLKVPRPRRHRLVVAATADGEIWWVEGLRIAERFKLTDTTRRVLEWRWRRCG